MYSLLLIFTPFIMLHAFLQESISKLSQAKVAVFDQELPLSVLLGILVLVGFIIGLRKRITRYRAVVFCGCCFMVVLSQNICDYYSGNPFYDLQQIWHYLAYAGFTFFTYRYFSRLNYPAPQIIVITYCLALVLSLFDEAFQFFLASRVFDINDTAKDGWGTLIGLIVIYLVWDHGLVVKREGYKVRHDRIRDYFDSPTALLVLGVACNFCFLVVSALMSELRLLPYAMATTGVISVIIVALIHYSRIKLIRRAVATTVVLGAAVQLVSFINYRDRYIVYNRPGLTVYKGIVVPLVDFLIYPNGLVRPVDKKHSFNTQDQAFLGNLKPDILLVGSGSEGQGGLGLGLQGKITVDFYYNPAIQRCTQLIVAPTPIACRIFNQLKETKESRIVFVVHNTD